MENKIQLYSKALKVGTLPLVFKKRRKSWAAFMPKRINEDGSVAEISDIAVCDFSHMTLRRLRFTVASRYLAQVYEDSMVCYINMRWAMKLPNWGNYGALSELAHAMKRAGLI